MNRSEQINELAEALSKAQSEMGVVTKTQSVKNKNGKLLYKYATLEDVLDVIQKPLAKNGLVITQLMDTLDNKPALTTLLMHNSGQWIQSTVPLIQVRGINTNAAQDLGIAATFEKRYSLTSICMLSSQDDTDGRTGGDPAPQKKAAPVEKNAPATAPTGEQYLDIVKVGAWETSNGKKNIGLWVDGAQYPDIYWWGGRENFLDQFADDKMTKDGLGTKGTTYPFKAKAFYTVNDKGYKDLVRLERIT